MELRREKAEDMDTSDFPWCWYYLADCGRWHQFKDDPENPFSSDNVEKYYEREPKGVLKISTLSGCSQIDLSAMLQTELETGRQRRIQRGFNVGRSCSCFSAAPIFWENVDPTTPYQLIPLSKLSPEYKTVEDYVKVEGLLNRSIHLICRIQNLDLWEIYCRKKKQLMRIHGVKKFQERRLFHGTEVTNVDSICKYNFDLRLAGQHGHVYGKGIYFAKHASFADRYSSISTDPLPLHGLGTDGRSSEYRNTQILARVIVGKSNEGHSNFTKPDHKSLDNSHDSCVDDVNDPKIYVIFDPNQIYPEYVIQYE
ncbi:protein mono-ADP-ribosyltransferase PARP11-like [Cololabis saira]|uniref:protein mono-ADP-ribosyltransferase PARP11-like n=1 Tax=Cololabis saira TaxID=129043 RepID=UPI002AD46226|nr:protein mono-ADP-ribosyltransferase PARP11-like [Cololabis saira]